MGPRCSSAETQVCHRSYIIAASIYCVYMPLWHQLMNQKPLFSISENYSQHCQTTLSWSKYYSLVSIGVNRSVPVQSVTITTKVVSSTPVHGEVNSIQHYVIKFVSDLRQVGGFLRYPPPIKLSATI